MMHSCEARINIHSFQIINKKGEVALSGVTSPSVLVLGLPGFTSRIRRNLSDAYLPCGGVCRA